VYGADPWEINFGLSQCVLRVTKGDSSYLESTVYPVEIVKSSVNVVSGKEQKWNWILTLILFITGTTRKKWPSRFKRTRCKKHFCFLCLTVLLLTFSWPCCLPVLTFFLQNVNNQSRQSCSLPRRFKCTISHMIDIN